MLVHRRQVLIDGRLKLLEFFALLGGQADIPALFYQFAAPDVHLPPCFLFGDLAQGTTEQVTSDLLGSKTSRGSLSLQLCSQRIVEGNGEVHGQVPCRSTQ